MTKRKTKKPFRAGPDNCWWGIKPHVTIYPKYISSEHFFYWRKDARDFINDMGYDDAKIVKVRIVEVE